MTATSTLTIPEVAPAPDEPAQVRKIAKRHSLATDYAELGKIRLNAMVLITAAVGFILGNTSLGGSIPWPAFAWTLLGTGLAAVGAAAFNQVMEVELDARMERTKGRPLPAGRMSKAHALLFAFATAVAGLAILNECVNPLTAFLGMLNLVVYVLLYTPLKTRTSLNTLVGAVCGALPPMMGWAAATGELPIGAWLLATILFLWQIPHFLALAWMYRVDYARGGFRMVPAIDPTGRLTCILIMLYTLALLPLGVAVMLAGVSGWFFAAGSLLLGAWFLWMGIKLTQQRTRENARRLFLASVIYLPVLLILMVANAQGPGYDPKQFPTEGSQVNRPGAVTPGNASATPGAALH